MRKLLSLSLALVSTVALADHRTPRKAAEPAKSGTRTVGVHVTEHPDKPYHTKDNPAHQYVVKDAKGHEERHAVVVEHRPAHVVDRDPRLRIVARGYRTKRDWVRFHRAHGEYWRLWGITAWDTVGTVTCEAVNEATGELFPVSEDRDSTGWDDDSVNAILDQALDDCYDAANGAQCGPVQPACSFQPY